MIRQAQNVINRDPVPMVQHAGVTVTHIVMFNVSENYVAATDVIELTGLPAESGIVGADLLSEGITEAVTLTVGYLSGTYGSKEGDRQVTPDLFDGVANDQAHSLDPKAAMALSSIEENRAIGMTFSGDVAAGAGKNVYLRLRYAK